MKTGSEKLFDKKITEKMSKEEYFQKDSVPVLIKKWIAEDYRKRNRIFKPERDKCH